MIARLTGIPRTTIRDWRHGRATTYPRRALGEDGSCGLVHDYTRLLCPAYAYLLAMYLGDGYIAHHRRGVWKLRVTADSDGCRIVVKDRGVESVRYHFSNRSGDIKDLFCTSLDRLGIPWTRPCDRQIAIYRKSAVARMDQFVGPKY